MSVSARSPADCVVWQLPVLTAAGLVPSSSLFGGLATVGMADSQRAPQQGRQDVLPCWQQFATQPRDCMASVSSPAAYSLYGIVSADSSGLCVIFLACSRASNQEGQVCSVLEISLMVRNRRLLEKRDLPQLVVQLVGQLPCLCGFVSWQLSAGVRVYLCGVVCGLSQGK